MSPISAPIIVPEVPEALLYLAVIYWQRWSKDIETTDIERFKTGLAESYLSGVLVLRGAAGACIWLKQAT